MIKYSYRKYPLSRWPDVTAMGDQLDRYMHTEINTTNEIIIASDENEIITTTDTDTKVLLRKGTDKLISGKGNDTFYFREGDGVNTIYDKGGLDRLLFDTQITKDRVEIKLIRNSDLVIAIKEDGKTFDELSDKVTLKNYMSENKSTKNNVNYYSLKSNIININPKNKKVA